MSDPSVLPKDRENNRRVMISLGVLVVSECVDAFSQDEQWGVDVSGFFQTLSFILSLGTSLGASQVTQTQPDDRHVHPHYKQLTQKADAWAAIALLNLYNILFCIHTHFFNGDLFYYHVSCLHKFGESKVSLTRWLREPSESQYPQSLICGWRKYCDCRRVGKKSNTHFSNFVLRWRFNKTISWISVNAAACRPHLLLESWLSRVEEKLWFLLPSFITL